MVNEKISQKKERKKTGVKSKEAEALERIWISSVLHEKLSLGLLGPGLV